MVDLSDIFYLFARFGDRSYGEDVTQLAHALEAAHFAHEAGESDAMVAAALLHDVGQLLDEAGSVGEREARDARHELTGADYLARWFPEPVLAPIRLHVAAKRYLCWREPDYLGSLSAASALSLRLQGGAFSDEEAAAFIRLPFAEEGLRLWRYDDRGKVNDLAVPALDFFHPMLSAMAR